MQKADDGVIEKIVLINFMCHKHYEVELDSNINFIIGPNGSMLVRVNHYSAIIPFNASLVQVGKVL